MIALLQPSTIVLAAVEEAAPARPEVFGVGALALTLAVVAVLGWMTYLYVNSRRRRSAELEEAPDNLSPYLSDDELENVRSTRVLRGAVFAAAFLAIIMTIYAAAEPSRQAKAADNISEQAIERGEELYQRFGCVGCHGPDAGGGAAPFTEARSNVDTAWVVPSLNDIFFRYSDEEIRFWITYGRPGTPMPANGLEGGGAMTFQEIDEVMAYLRSIQISQADTLAKRDGTVQSALARMANGDTTTAQLIAVQEAKIAEIAAAPGKVDAAGTLDSELEALLAGAGTCTVESAHAVEKPCDDPAPDTDRDGLSDAAEPAITEIAAAALEHLTVLNTSKTGEQLEPVFDPNPVYDKRFDPDDPFTNVTSSGRAVPDLDAAIEVLESLRTDLLLLRVAAERQDAFLGDLQLGLDYLRRAADERRWILEPAAVAEAMTRQLADDAAAMEAVGADPEDIPTPRVISVDEAERAIGLFNGYCARCHTGGWSAGPTFEQGPGSGAWGPSLKEARSVVQFPNWTDQVKFVIKGTDQAAHYGVNGIGSGRMPGFGMVLSEEDIELIVMFERSLR